jgi:phosphatidylserine decarboxylase
MSSLHADNITKPIDPQTRDILCHPDTGEVHSADHAAQALYAAVDATSEHADVTQGIHAPTHKIASHGIFAKLVPGLQHLADRFHIGNFVMIRGTGEKFFESMPIYTR